jgi:hypothetical protein
MLTMLTVLHASLAGARDTPPYGVQEDLFAPPPEGAGFLASCSRSRDT